MMKTNQDKSKALPEDDMGVVQTSGETEEGVEPKDHAYVESQRLLKLTVLKLLDIELKSAQPIKNKVDLTVSTIPVIHTLEYKCIEKIKQALNYFIDCRDRIKVYVDKFTASEGSFPYCTLYNGAANYRKAREFRDNWIKPQSNDRESESNMQVVNKIEELMVEEMLRVFKLAEKNSEVMFAHIDQAFKLAIRFMCFELAQTIRSLSIENDGSCSPGAWRSYLASYMLDLASSITNEDSIYEAFSNDFTYLNTLHSQSNSDNIDEFYDRIIKAELNFKNVELNLYYEHKLCHIFDSNGQTVNFEKMKFEI